MNSNRIWGWWAVDHATFQMDTEYALYFEFFVDCTYEELKSLQKNHVLYINGTSFDLETDQQLWDNEANGARIFVLAKLGKAPYLVIDTAAVTGLDTPKPGSIPSQTVTIPSGSHYTFKSAQWWVQYNEKSYLLSSDSKFEFGKTYLCYIVLDAEKGYKFTTDTVGKINGNTVESYPEVSTIRLKYVYTVPSLLTGASITLKEPTVNGTVSDAKGSVPSESKYSLHYQGWYRTQGLSAPVSGTFEDGQIYYYAALLKPETGWEFAGTASGTSGNIDSSVVNATINGKAASSIYWYNGAITTPSVADGTGWIRVYGRYVLGLEINAENFPDFKFRDYVSEYIDKDESGVLSDAERNAVTEIDIDGCDNEAYYWGIQSLEGIEHFPNLQYLYCGSPLTTLDLSGNKKLIEVRLNNDDAGGKLTSLNVKGCTALETLSLYDNQVKSLDLSTNKSLRYLFLDGNALTSLNLEENRNLETLAVDYNKSLTSLDLRLNSKLRTLSINGSGLSSIDLRTQEALEILQCENCGLTALDLKTTRR